MKSRFLGKATILKGGHFIIFLCPECHKEMIWVTDQSDVENISQEYYCNDYDIELVKYNK